ncbi:MAG TPA: hypothetical protein DCG34_02985, partial [Clostridiales bacterium]|nr:hypothetical protein [Clostridiales bacterium]
GDGLLIYYESTSTLLEDEKFPSILESIVKASSACIQEYSTVMLKKATIKEKAAGAPFQLGISIGSGYLYDFNYKVKNKGDEEDFEIHDIGSIDLTYVFRLNKFANPEGIVVDSSLYEDFKGVFEGVDVFRPKRKLIDAAFGEKVIYTSRQVMISEEETETDIVLQAYRALGRFSINVCNQIIKREIDTKTFPLAAPPSMRFMLFKCNDKIIEEVYNLYKGHEDGKKSTFDTKPVDEIKRDDQYPLLFYECYYEKKIVYFAYGNRYIRNVEKYIAESRKRFYLDLDDEHAKELFAGFEMRPSSALAIPILGKQKDNVNWILILDTEEAKAFKQTFFGALGVAVETFFDDQIRGIIETPNNL